MSIIDTEAVTTTGGNTLHIPTTKREVINLGDQDPLTFTPHGDRYLIEVVDIDDSIKIGDKTLLVELEKSSRGWAAGKIIAGGNGHRMDVPDTYVKINTTEKAPNPEIGLYFVENETGDAVVRCPSIVPMPFARGQIVMIYWSAAIEVKMQGKPYLICNQTHILGSWPIKALV